MYFSFNSNKQEQFWQENAQDFGITYMSGSYSETSQAYFTYKDQIIKLLLSASSRYGHNPIIFHAEMQTVFINKTGMSLCLYRENLFTDVQKLFGMQDIKIGDAQFDSQFVIKSNQPEKIREFLANDQLKQLIDFQEHTRIEIMGTEASFNGPHPNGADELYLACDLQIVYKRDLEYLFQLFTTTLDRLTEIGIIQTEV